jgi:threonyl-tRNA synthetase
MVHRALLGSLERFFGILLEHFDGAFPVWLAPVQATVVPIGERHEEAAAGVRDHLRAAGVRAELRRSDERMQARIREARLRKIPYILVLGDSEVASGGVNLRLRDGTVCGETSLDAFLSRFRDESGKSPLPAG